MTVAPDDTASREPAPGPLLFARYAYPPNELGYCGPDDSLALIESATRGTDRDLVAHLARQFEGAWPYLELIAASSGLDDPLDRRVVEAYWVGNELVRAVSPPSLAAALDGRFARRAGALVQPLVSAAFSGGVIQHSFHVFAVYPWLGLLRAERDGAPLEVLDRCRIRWGRVVEVNGDFVTVSSPLLRFDGSRLTVGPEQLEVVRRARDGMGFVHDLDAGCAVSLHWDWVCDRLSERSLRWLRACTQANLNAVNTLATPGPAYVCGA